MLAEQRAALAELAELPQADRRNLLQALESPRAVLARHPELWRLVAAERSRKAKRVDRLRTDRPSGDELVDRGAEPLGLAGSLRPRRLAGEAPADAFSSRALVLRCSATCP
jgi:hypothetical protein